MISIRLLRIAWVALVDAQRPVACTIFLPQAIVQHAGVDANRSKTPGSSTANDKMPKSTAKGRLDDEVTNDHGDNPAIDQDEPGKNPARAAADSEHSSDHEDGDSD